MLNLDHLGERLLALLNADDKRQVLASLDDQEIIELFDTGVWLADLCGMEAVVRNSVAQIAARRPKISTNG